MRRVAVLAITFAGIAAAQTAVDSRLVQVDGRKVHIRTLGTGRPAVVLAAGFGDSSDSWEPLLTRIAAFTTVFAFDRAGIGESAAGPEPRSFVNVAKELHGALRAARVPPPYLLVGHSLGGAHVRAFAHLYPNETAAMVLVDPMVEYEWTPETRRKALADLDQMMKSAPPGVGAEARFLREESADDFRELHSFGAPPNVPLAILIATRGKDSSQVGFQIEVMLPWVRANRFGHLTITPDSGHYIQKDQPELVISSIRDVIAELGR